MCSIRLPVRHSLLLRKTIAKLIETCIVYLDVDTAYSSPYYGNIIGYQEALKPRAQSLQLVNFVYEVDVSASQEGQVPLSSLT